ncbi:MAG: phenylacetate--CoA ligase [Chloroflexi bacterium]|nr:phenylacetate--CoA ligase [Chloroflexota bacterium]
MDIPALVTHLALNAPGFARRLQSADLTPDSFRSPDDLDRLPVIRKDDLVEYQAADPPFGGFLACAPGDLKRIFQSPGPIYDPESRVPDYWRWKPAMVAAGFRPGDVVMNAFGYHLTPAGAMFEEGLWAAGCTVIPGGIGNQEQQIRLLHDLRVTGYVGLPSYLKALIEKAADLGLETHIEKAFFTAEPLPPSLRAWLNEHGVTTARQGYGTAECGNLGYECGQEDGWHIPDDAIIQICDINTGRPLPPGETGEIVVTLLNRDYALVRFGTGDLSTLNPAPCPCGRTSARLMGWQGRIGDAVKVRGMFLHPRQVDDLMKRFPQVARWQAVVTREEHKDYLTLHVVPAKGADAASLPGKLAKAAREALKFQLSVELVDSLPDDAPPVRDTRTWD